MSLWGSECSDLYTPFLDCQSAAIFGCDDLGQAYAPDCLDVGRP